MDNFNPTQMITLCLIFVGFHALALPPFLWAMRHRQFAGREQKEWNLDSGMSPEMPIADAPAMPLSPKARVLLGILSVVAVTMLASIFLTVFVAMHATAHPATGKCPF